MAQRIPFIKEESLENYTEVLQVEDGTNFYFRRAKPQRLYIKWNGQEIDADLRNDYICTAVPLGNAVYIVIRKAAGQAIFKVEAELDKVNVTFMRNTILDESVNEAGLNCWKRSDGNSYVSTVNSRGMELVNGVRVDIDTQDFEAQCIHRGQLYLVRATADPETELNILGDKLVGISMPLTSQHYTTYVREDSKYLFVSSGNKLYTIDPEGRQQLPVLEFYALSDLKIVSVVEGVITLTARDVDEYFLIRAEFPERYFESGRPIEEFTVPAESNKVIFTSNTATKSKAEVVKAGSVQPKLSPLDQRIKEMAQELEAKKTAQDIQKDHEKFLDKKLNEIKFKAPEDETEEAKKTREYEEEMSATLNQLIDQNMELTQQLEELKSQKEQKDDNSELELAALCERNEELTKKKAELENINWELTVELDRIEELNDQLEKDNEALIKETEELTRRKEEREKKRKETIAELEAKNAAIDEEIKNTKLVNQEIDASTEDILKANDVLKRSIKKTLEMNEKMAKVLEPIETSEESSGEEYEMMDENNE